MVTTVAGIAPAAVVMKVTGAITPGGPSRTPGALTGNPTPVAVTAVPGKPLVGERVIAAGGGVTVKVAVAETTPTVALKVCAATGAPGSMVTMRAICPPAPVMKDVGAMAPGAVRVPGALTGKPAPITDTTVPGRPDVGVRVSVCAAAGVTITAVRLATKARTVSTLSILCFVFIYVSPFFSSFKF
jgi:hypothetical protein